MAAKHEDATVRPHITHGLAAAEIVATAVQVPAAKARKVRSNVRVWHGDVRICKGKRSGIPTAAVKLGCRAPARQALQPQRPDAPSHSRGCWGLGRTHSDTYTRQVCCTQGVHCVRGQPSALQLASHRSRLPLMPSDDGPSAGSDQTKQALADSTSHQRPHQPTSERAEVRGKGQGHQALQATSAASECLVHILCRYPKTCSARKGQLGIVASNISKPHCRRATVLPFPRVTPSGTPRESPRNCRCSASALLAPCRVPPPHPTC